MAAPYHKVCRTDRLKGIFVDDPIKSRRYGKSARGRPAVVVEFNNAVRKCHPLPPHITLRQAKAFAASVDRRPGGTQRIIGTARQVLSSILPASADKSDVWL